MPQQGPLLLIETLLSRVASSLVWWHALEFSSCQKWGSCGFCSLCDECFPRIPQPLLPRGHFIFRWGCVSTQACVQGCVCGQACLVMCQCELLLNRLTRGKSEFWVIMWLFLWFAPKLKLQNQYSRSDWMSEAVSVFLFSFSLLTLMHIALYCDKLTQK